MVQLHLKHEKVDINATSKTGDSPLQMAVRGGHKDVVQLLLKHGADVNAKCKVNKGAFLTSFEFSATTYTS